MKTITLTPEQKSALEYIIPLLLKMEGVEVATGLEVTNVVEKDDGMLLVSYTYEDKEHRDQSKSDYMNFNLTHSGVEDATFAGYDTN